MSEKNRLLILTGNANRPLAATIAHALGGKLAECDISSFDDGEARIRIIDNARGQDTYIIQPTNQPDRNATELELMIMALRSSATRITAVIPYFGYARQDRKDQARVPISVVRAVRNLVSTGVDRILLLDLHTAQIVGIFEAANPSIRVDHIYARPVLLDWLCQQDLSNTTIASIDIGGAKMVESYWTRLQQHHPVEMGLAHKSGTASQGIKKLTLLGQYAGRDIIYIDDMISSGSSVMAAASTALEAGAKSVSIVAVHAVFASDEACQKLAASPLKQIVVTDTLDISPERRKILGSKLVVVSVAPLLAAAIKHLHEEDQLSHLFELEAYQKELTELVA